MTPEEIRRRPDLARAALRTLIRGDLLQRLTYFMPHIDFEERVTLAELTANEVLDDIDHVPMKEET